MFNHTNRSYLNKWDINTQSSIGGICSITGLTFLGIYISIIYYSSIFTTYSLCESLGILEFNSPNYLNYINPTMNVLNFVSSLNWLIIQIIVLIVFSSWRKVNNPDDLFFYLFFVTTTSLTFCVVINVI
jgi:hypothetical protein